MSKIKALVTIGIVTLLTSVSINPVLASVIQPQDQIVYSICDEQGAIQTLCLSESEAKKVDALLADITEKMRTATSYDELISILIKSMKEWGRYPVLVLILSLIIKWIQLTNKINGIRPLRKNAFVISWGFTKKFNPFKENKAELYRPFTLWYYSGKSNFIVNSRTTVIDFSPFSIKSINGRQIGFMRNFAGIYIHRQTTFGENSYTLMLGRAMTVRGFDLSPFHN